MRSISDGKNGRRGSERLPCLVLLLTLALFSAVSCSRNEAPEERAAPIPSMPAEQPGLLYEVPAEWVQEPPSSRLRQAQFRLPREEGDPEDAELAIFYFGGQGGSVQGNIDRWVGQFRQPDGSAAQPDEVSTKESNGLTFTIVEVSGTYHQVSGSMMGGGEAVAKENFRMLAAIAETPTGPWFFKLAGPERTIAKWEEPFGTFLDTVRPARQTL